MSYPPPRYHGTVGEVSAIHRLEGQEPELSFPNGNKVHYLATAASTEGKFGLYRWDMSPEPSGADPHFHKTFSASFFILTGTVRLYDGDEWTDANPGRLPLRARGRDPRLQERAGCACLDAPAVLTRCSARSSTSSTTTTGSLARCCPG